MSDALHADDGQEIEGDDPQQVSISLEDDGVAVITLDRPDKLNALSATLLEELFVAGITLDEDESVRCVVITGSPEAKRPAFAAGADIEEMSEVGGLDLRDYSQLGQTTFQTIEGMSKPVIAAINGFALGGGLELAMACHIRYAASGAKLGQPEVNLGLIPGFGGTQRLPRLVGKGRALMLLLSGDPISADEASRAGLVDQVVPDEELMDSVMEFARKLAGKAPMATEMILDAVSRGEGLDKVSALNVESDLFGLVGVTEDVREGMTAFLEKRKPEWKGH